MVKINDGGGKNGDATVSNNQRLDVSARSASRQYYESRDQEQVFVATSVDATAVANEETMYIKNTSTSKDMVISEVIISTDTDSLWRVKSVTGTAAGSSALVPINLNRASSKSASATIRGDGAITGLTDVTDGTVALFRAPANNTHHHDFHEALRLGQDDALAVECETNAAVEITITFHFDSE